ncbi:MAG: ABC transporter permease [Acidobacteriales bacterium]|nr:MAG: ABC transporter permease [Terriglobales bacterium]
MINRLVIANLKHRPVRTLLSVLAIGVEVTMMLTLVGLSEGMLEDSARRARGVGADIIIRAPETSLISLSSASMPQKLMAFFAEQPHVALVAGTVVQPAGGINTITGIDLPEFNGISGGFKYLSGGPFRRPDDIIVDDFYATQNKLKVGSTVNLMNRDWHVSGIVEPGKLARLVIPRNTLQNLAGATGKLSQIYLKLDSPANTNQVIAALKEKLPDYKMYSIEELTSLYSVSNVPGLSAFIGVIIGLSIVVGFLVVFLSMYTAVLERTREVGILKALGASPGYVLDIIFRETLLLAVAGSVIGILMTYGSRWAIMTLVPSSLTQKIVPGWWPIAGAISVVGALLGSMYPAWKAARQDAIEALSYE